MNKKIMEGRVSVIVLAAAILAVIGLSSFIYAQNQETVEEELARLSQEITDAGYGWLVDYNGEDLYSKIEVYEKDKNELIARFSDIFEDKKYRVILEELNGTQDIFDLKIQGANGESVEFDYVVDPTEEQISACAVLSSANTIYYLIKNISSIGNCLTVTANNITIEGNGSSITYGTTSTLSNVHGINVKGANGTQINDVWLIKEGRYGTGTGRFAIRFSDAYNGTIFNNSIFTNTTSSHGIALYNTSFVNVTGNNFNISAGGTGSGILLTRSSNNTIISNNVNVSGTGVGGIQFDRSNNNSVSFNYIIISGSGDGIYMDLSNDSVMFSNIINLTGGGWGIDLVADLYRNNFSFNVVGKSNVNPTVYFTNSPYDNLLFFDSFFYSTTGSGVGFENGVGGYVNFTNVSFINKTALYVNDVISTAFNVHWYLDSQVNDTSNKAVASANVSGYNATGGIVFSVLTDSNGFIQKQQLLDYRQNSTDITYYSNYTINATKAGYSIASKPLNVTLVNNSFMSFVIDGRPDILFVSPTLANGSTTSNGFVEVNVSILDDTLKNVIFNWNETNYTIFNDSLVLYLNMNNYSALGDNETHVKDISNYGNNGTCMQISQTPSADISKVSACNQTLGKWGLGIRFNGKNETLNVSDKSSLDIESSFSLAAWINVADLPISNNVDGIIGKGTNDTGGYNYNYLLAIRRDSGPVNPKLSLIFGDGYDVNYSFSYSLNRWYHVAGVFDDSANTLTLYQDGIQVGQSTGITGTPATNAFNVMIGGATMTSDGPSGYGPDYFNGTIDEVMIWNRSLSVVEIEQLYKSSLYKINRTSWVLYVNQTKNITEALDEKVYTYYVFASDAGRNGNSTDTRSVRVDSVPLNISFVAPTLANGSSTTNTSVEVNISLLENNLKNTIFNWNGTNYTIYNNTLVLMYNMNNLSALGENATHVTDISNYSNNGSIVNWGSVFFNSSEGKFNGGYQFNGSGYITRAYDSDFDFGTNGFAVEAWFKQSELNPVITRVQRTTNSTASGSGTVVTCTLGAAATLGNLLVTAVASDKSAGTYTVPSGFTMINTTSATSTSGGLAFKIANGTETIIRWTQSTSSLNGITCWAAEYSGLVTSGVVDVSAENETFSSANTATTTINSGITNVTSQADELAIVMVSIDTATSCDGSRALTGGFSEEAFLDASTGLMVANKTLSVRGRQNTTYSCSGDTGDQMYATIATFKAIIWDSTISARYDSDQGFKLWMNSSGNVLFGIDDDSTWDPDDLAVSGTGYDNNIWHHAIGVRNATGIYLYVDGQLAGSDISIAATGTLSSDSASLSWGVDEPTDQYFWNGSLDEARVWNYGLSAGDVLEHYFSNLYKVNTTNWLLYVNQSKNATDGLDLAVYTYYAFASDTASVGNSTDTRTVTVSAPADTTSPLVTINFPANTTYGFSNNILRFNVSLNENGSVMYSLNGGRNNKTMLFSADHVSVFGDIFNHTNNSIADGQYVFSVYANDTAGNKNYTENITFSVDFTFPKINLSSPANNSNLIGNNSAILNWTINDTSNNNEIFVWATNDSANLYDYLVYHRKDQVNGTHAYNWSAPVLRANPTTTVLLLHFNNLSAYGENDTVAADFAQFDNNASITGFETPRWNETSGLLAGSFEMNGLISKTNISIADANALDLKNFTIAMWFLQRGSGDTASSGSGGVVVVPLIAKAVAEADGDGRDVNFMLGVNTSNNLAADFEDSTGPNHPVIGSQDVISNNVWYHVVYTHNYTTSTIYLNGKVSKMSVINSQPANNAIRVGIGQTYNSANVIDGAFNGTIDELIIYNISLSRDEIILFYNHSLGRKYWQVNVTDGAGNMNSSFIYEFNMTVPTVDTTPPIVTINNPLIAQNISTSSLMFNVSLSENGSIMYSLDGGRNNKTMLFSADHVSVFGTEFNHTNSSIADGIYVMSVYANDTSGNKNYTENRTFTIDTTLPVPSYRTPRNLANGTQVNQSSVFIELDIVDLNFKNVTFGLYNDSAYFNESSLDYHYGFDLARYQRVMNNSNLALAVDSSDITFNPVNETLFVIHNTVGSESIDEIYINGSLRRSITLTGFHDTEAITYMNTSGGTHRFVVGEEQRANLTAIFIDDSTTTYARTSGVMYDLGLGNWGNLGLEGVTYDSRRDVYYIVKEQRDMLVYQINVSTSPVTSTILINVTQINATQGQVVNDLSSLYYDNNTDTLFLLSHESQHAYNIYRNGTFINNLSINHMTQPEGITFSRLGDYMYVIGEADFLSSWKTANVSSSINYTGLANGTYYYNVTAYDYAGNRNASITRTIILGTVGAAPANVAPTTPTPDINSTRGTNRTSENLHCFDTLIDPDGGRLNVSVDWFNKTTLHVAIDYNNSYANNTFFESTLGHLNTTNGENWTCGMRLFDGSSYSARANATYSVNITALSIPTLSSPGHASSTGDRTPNFTWSANTDDATSDITYQLNVSLVGASTCSEESRHISSISATSHELASELMCFIDNNDYYNWSVRLTDTREFSSWSSFFRINITSENTITLLNRSIEFGTLNNSASDDTSDDSPLPLLLRNDGNVFLNITINASDLWATQPNPSSYYRFKIANYSFENGSFDWGLSKVTYTNMPAAGSPLLAIALFNYTNASDTAEIDINITVPVNEVSGVKRSFITFISSLHGG